MGDKKKGQKRQKKRQKKRARTKAVIPAWCEHSQVITVERSIGLEEREHAHEYIYTCQYMHIYTHTQTSPMCDTFKKKNALVQPSKRLSTASIEPEQRLNSASIAT